MTTAENAVSRTSFSLILPNISGLPSPIWAAAPMIVEKHSSIMLIGSYCKYRPTIENKNNTAYRTIVVCENNTSGTVDNIEVFDNKPSNRKDKFASKTHANRSKSSLYLVFMRLLISANKLNLFISRSPAPVQTSNKLVRYTTIETRFRW